MSKNPIGAVLFDCDGTLVDSEDLGLHVMADQARALGADLPDDLVAQLRGRSMRSCFELFARRLGRPLPGDFEARVREAQAAAFRQGLRPMPGALETVAALPVPACIVTNGPRAKAELTLGLTGLAGYFTGRIFCAYEVGTFKPEPGLYLHAAHALGVAPARCAVVEDSEAGMLAGLRAGMQVYAVRGHHPLPQRLAGQVHVLDALTDLLDAVGAR